MTSAFFTACIQESQSVPLTDLSNPENLSRALYSARSHLALQPPSTSSALSVLAPALKASSPPASAKAVAVFAEYISATEGDPKSGKVEELRDLLLEYEEEGDAEDEGEEGEVGMKEEERIVRVMAGTAFILEGEVEEAYATLTEGCGKTDLEW